MEQLPARAIRRKDRMLQAIAKLDLTDDERHFLLLSIDRGGLRELYGYFGTIWECTFFANHRDMTKQLVLLQGLERKGCIMLDWWAETIIVENYRGFQKTYVLHWAIALFPGLATAGAIEWNQWFLARGTHE